ncbi:MAG TPA: toll/interleukin-1 receptor domain-containing protein [Vicinamibacterales bacterium]|nr:toll/interleukin-1 receptor domain-containing protein [Vicinamibacterales bacterium]
MERSLIFIAYRRGESAGYAGRLHESLERRLGGDHVFRDVDELEPGQDFVDAISARLRDCAACLVIIGSEWLLVTDRAGHRRLEQSDDYLRLEIEAALARSDLLVVPVLVEDATMPSAEDLPAPIRALSRRHALSLRDETWDADVDRLAETLKKKIGRTPTEDVSPVSRLPRLPPSRLIGWCILAVALIAAAMFLNRGTEVSDAGTPPPEAAVITTTGAAPTGPALAIALPRLAEVAHGHLIYALLSGAIASTGDATTLRLRIRVSNEGEYQANFWDGSFRFAVRGQVLSPTSGLNEIVDSHAIKQGVVTFDLPKEVARGSLQVISRDVIAEIPLDLKTTGAPSGVESPDVGDALSRTQIARVITHPLALTGGNVTYTLDRMIARRFVNTLRIIATVRAVNNGRYPWLFGSGAIRLLANGQSFAPFGAPNAAVDPSSAAEGDFIFDVPPSTRRVLLRVTDPRVDRWFDLPLPQ